MSQTNPLIIANQVMIDSAIKDLKFDKTIIATISEIIDKTKNQYRVEYEGGKFHAYAESATYAIGDTVYVNIPNGDYSNKKIITSKVENVDDNIPIYDLENSLLYSDRKFTWYRNGVKPEETELFKKYLEIYSNNYIILSIGISKIGQDPIKNNYGVKIVIDNDEYIFDIRDMNGSLFEPNGEIYTKIFKLPEYSINSIQSIGTSFIGEDIGIAYDLTESEYSKTIFIDFMEINFASTIDLSKAFYHLDLKQTHTNPNTVFSGKLFHEGEFVNAYKYEWYKEDTINFIKDNNNNDLGYCWSKIEDSNYNSYTVPSNSEDSKYKLLAYYNENSYITQEIMFQNTATDFNEFSIELNEENKPIFKYYNQDINRTISHIAYFTPEGKLIQNVEKVENTNIIWNNYSYIIVYFKHWDNEYTAESLQSDKCIGTFSVILTIKDDKRLDIIGQNLFHYDYNGNIDEKIASKTYILSPKIEGYEVTNITWELTQGLDPSEKNDSFQIGPGQGQIYYPKNSMIDKVWVDYEYQLHFTIKNTYSIHNYNNIFRATAWIIDPDKGDTNQDILKSISQTQEIYFVKEGQQGTNGTDYCCIIRPITALGQYLNDEEAIVNENSGIFYKAIIYQKGKEIINISNIQFSWSLFSKGKYIKLTETSNKILINKDKISLEKNYFLTVTIDIDQQILYYHYPIYSGKGDITLKYLEMPKFIQYSDVGTSPQWYDREIKSNDMTSKLSISSNLQFSSKGQYIIPPYKIQNGMNMSIIELWENGKIKIQCPIILYTNYYNKNTIQNWAGTDIKVQSSDNLDKVISNPQLGVGQTNEEGYFTGVIMAEKEGAGGGLYGYNENNQQQFALESSGNVSLGPEGQIQIDSSGNTSVGGWRVNANTITSNSGTTTLNHDGITTNSITVTDNTHAGKMGIIEGANGVPILGIQAKGGDNAAIEADYIRLTAIPRTNKTADIKFEIYNTDIGITLTELIDTLKSIETRLTKLETPKT